MAITGRLALLAALGLALAPLSARWLFGYAVALVLLVAVDLLLAGAIGDLRLGRDASAAVRLGESSSTALRIRNTGSRTVRGVVRDAWTPSAGVRPGVQRVAISPGATRRVQSELRPTRRGERRAVTVAVRSLGPLGLAGRQRRLVCEGSVRVLPPFTSRRLLPEKLGRLRLVDGAVVVRRRGQGSEFDSLREYVLGDDVRSIDWRASARSADWRASARSADWRASARSADLMVRTWRPERDRQIVLAIDTGRAAAARVGDETRLDAVIDAALLLAAVATRAGDRVSMVAADVLVRARMGAATASTVLPRLVDALTPLEPALVESDPTLMVAEVARAVRRRSLVVLFTGLDADEGLLPAARALSSKNQLLVAGVADPRLAELIDSVGDAAEVYTAAAAELAVRRRLAVSDHLSRVGARVVDAPPTSFASAVTDAYLDLKAAGRL